MRGALLYGLVVIGGCAAPHELTLKQGEFVAAHPELTYPDFERLKERQVLVGDTLERVKDTWDGAEFELMKEDGTLAIYRVHVPIDVRPIYMAHEVADEEGWVMLTFDRQVLKSYYFLGDRYH